jgi:hypothetical protein
MVMSSAAAAVPPLCPVPPGESPPGPVPSRPGALEQDYVCAWLSMPVEVEAGREFAVRTGLRRPDAPATAETSPYRSDVDVALIVDPEGFEPVSPGGEAVLGRSADTPWPEVEIRLVPRVCSELRRQRRISVAFLQRGHIVDVLSREVLVRPAGWTGQPGQDPAPSVGLPRDLRRTRDDEAPDLTIFVIPSDGAGRLVFRAVCPHHTPTCPSWQPSAKLQIDGAAVDTGTVVESIRRHAARSHDDLELFTWLHGLGRQLYLCLPSLIRDVLTATVARGTFETASTILFASQEPWIPWELAAPDDGRPWGSGADTESPFLGAHAAVSHWPVNGLASQTADPISRLTPRHKVLVARTHEEEPYRPEDSGDGFAGRGDATEPGMAVVAPVLDDVVRLLNGDPPADLMHFVVRGTVEDPGEDSGLFLLEAAGTPRTRVLTKSHLAGARLTRPAFVFLNTCQVDGSRGLPAGDYLRLAAAFLAAGAGAVVAPAWTTGDEPANRLITEFYDLSSGPSPAPVGEILRRFRARCTRQTVERAGSRTLVSLLAFQLFGHPAVRLFLDG